MEDRQPTFPGRVELTDVETGAKKKYDLKMADEPTQPGTPPIKANLLQDATEQALFGNIGNRTVNQAFLGIANKLKLIMQDQAAITLTVLDDATGRGVAGVYVDGVLDESGNTAKTNSSGVINGFIAEGETTVSVSQYGDIEDFSKTFTIVKGSTYNETIRVTTRNFLQLTESASVRFSENVSRLDVNPVGGGGGAGAGAIGGTIGGTVQAISGGAGGGGYCVVKTSVVFKANQFYTAIIGAGGHGNDSGNGRDGGESSFAGVTAAGGKGGTEATIYQIGISEAAAGVGGQGNGKGADGLVRILDTGADQGTNGTNGTVLGFSSFTETVRYGGGGGSGAVACYTDPGIQGGKGGADYGGDGGSGGFVQEFYNGKDGTGFGGGGGSAYCYDSDNKGDIGRSGSGYQGVVNMRMHLATAS